MSYWTVVNSVFVLGSLIMYFAVTFTMYSDGMFLVLPSAFPFIGESSLGLVLQSQRTLGERRLLSLS